MTADDRIQMARTDDRVLGRLLTSIADDPFAESEILARLFREGGGAHTIGVTGPPGAGKSTLTNALVADVLARTEPDQRVGVIAVDPSSPFTGGAILGDRIRMGDHSGDPRVFIRSVSNRGVLGGIATSTPAVVAALDGLGFSHVLVETVGIGQSEIDIASTCLTTVVVVPADWGDSVQASKAGFLEVGDVFVVSKADRPGAERTVADLSAMLDIVPSEGWRAPVLPTTALDGGGVASVVDAIEAHRRHLRQSDAERARQRSIAVATVEAAVETLTRRALAERMAPDVDAVVDRSTDPWSVAASFVDNR